MPANEEEAAVPGNEEEVADVPGNEEEVATVPATELPAENEETEDGKDDVEINIKMKSKNFVALSMTLLKDES